MAKAETSPARGSTITFLLRDEHGERLRVGEVVGPVETDPITGESGSASGCPTAGASTR